MDQIVPDASVDSDVDENSYVVFEIPDEGEEYKPPIVEQPQLGPLLGAINVVPQLSTSLFNGIQSFNWSAWNWYAPEESLTEKEQINKHLKKILEDCGDLYDELNRRKCLVDALTNSVQKVIEDTELSEEVLERMKLKKNISARDYEYIKIYKGWSERMHCLFLLIIHRDFQTLLEFLMFLKLETCDEIVRDFEELLKGDPKVTNSCTWCDIKTTVNIVYVVASLLAIDIQMWSNVNTEAIDVIGKMDESESIWDMVQDIVCNKPEFKLKVVAVLIKALDACGFHSDIVRLLEEDKNLGRDSLQCRHLPSCKETLECKANRAGEDKPIGSDKVCESDNDSLPLSKETDETERKCVWVNQEIQSSETAVPVNSGPGSLKRKNSECSDKQDGRNKKKSLEDDFKRAGGRDKPKGSDNSKRTGSKTDSDSMTRKIDSKIGIPDSDKCVCESDNDSLPVTKETDETERKCVGVNQEIQTSETAVPVNSGPGSLKRKNLESSDKQDDRYKKKSHEDDLKRADGRDKPKRIDNSNSNDSDSAIRMDNLKIGHPDYDEGIYSSEYCLSLSWDTDETKRKWVCVDQGTQTSESGTAENVGASMALINDTVQPAMRDGEENESAIDTNVPFENGDQHQGTDLEEGQAVGTAVVGEEFYCLDGSYSVVSNGESQNEPVPFINIHTRFKNRGGNS